ncbi:MAG: molecular chaperone TorD family protein [Polynucleobacter sp.]|nr:molecular chaperone TorD family protein [Polynucleobacter sp.]MDZ4056932.1 molecular chaperone TorD family protein [Polynucleobacter sp.]
MSESTIPTGRDAPTEVGDIGTPEDLARADLYGLLASLYFEPPDQTLLDMIVASVPEGSPPPDEAPLSHVWQGLVDAAKESKAADWKAEYSSEFMGVGRPNVFLNSSFYLAGHLNEKPLVEVRRALAEFGLESSEEVTETEDHVSALFEVMRYLIAGDDVEISNLTNQRVFFNDHIRPWYDDLCDAIENNPAMHLYYPVAALTREFLAIEGQAFDMM